MIAIVDYGAGNLRNVDMAFAHLGANAIVTNDASAIANAEGIVLPGVGAFGWAMESIRGLGLEGVLREAAAAAASGGRPFLGICLGLQLLFDQSEESPGVKGLGVEPGRVARLPASGLKIPHMGWNQVCTAKSSRLFDGIANGSYFYFVHSYYPEFDAADDIAATTDYGIHAPIALERGNLFATQFHLEKSGAVGLNLLCEFIGMCGEGT